MCFVLGEHFSEVFRFFRNQRGVSLSDFIDSREIFEETDDFIEVQDINFIV